jgi:elongation factor Ts
MTTITATEVKKLRDQTGAGMMECKAALTEANGDFEEANLILRKRGLASAAKKARATREGLIGSHPPGGKIGVLVEPTASPISARTDDFQTLRELALQVAAASPQMSVMRTCRPTLERERSVYRAQMENPASRHDRRSPGSSAPLRAGVPGRSAVDSRSQGHGQRHAAGRHAGCAENIAVARFVRFKVGETL